jgi:hypothetical protein
MPIIKVTTSNTTGQTHHAVVLAGGTGADAPASLANAQIGLSVRAQTRDACIPPSLRNILFVITSSSRISIFYVNFRKKHFAPLKKMSGYS